MPHMFNISAEARVRLPTSRLSCADGCIEGIAPRICRKKTFSEIACRVSTGQINSAPYSARERRLRSLREYHQVSTCFGGFGSEVGHFGQTLRQIEGHGCSLHGCNLDSALSGRHLIICERWRLSVVLQGKRSSDRSGLFLGCKFGILNDGN